MVPSDVPETIVALGAVVTVSLLAVVLALTVMLLLVTDVRPLVAKVNVCVVAIAFRVSPVNVTTPPTAFTVVVPAKVPVPLMVTVTAVVALEIKFPLASVIQITGCVARATPTVAVVDG